MDYELPDTMLTRDNLPQGWQLQHTAAQKLHALDARLSAKDYGTLISAIRSGLPVIVVTIRDGYRETHTMVIDYMCISNVGSANRIRVRYWGFGHYIWLSQIESLGIPDFTITPSGK